MAHFMLLQLVRSQPLGFCLATSAGLEVIFLILVGKWVGVNILTTIPLAV